jgi:hypothetical protein
MRTTTEDFMAKTPNPQGKGLVPILAEWDAITPKFVRAKSAPQIMGEYFTSLLVLSAKFGFKPVPGKPYYLYWKKTSAKHTVKQATTLEQSPWRLSLIEPERLGGLAMGAFIGSCILQNDMTWTIEPSADIAEQTEAVEDLRLFHQQFHNSNNHQQSLEASLPFFIDELPFYRRLAATALSSSLSRSIEISQLENIPASQWLENNKDAGMALLPNNPKP